jgi:hypothetical protein
LFAAIDKGKLAWGVPAYNGGLFSPDEDASPSGSALAKIELPDSVLGPALRSLLVEDTGDCPGPVDFRSLGVREFGTIYEGLLENDLAIATVDLVAEDDGSYRPAGRRDDKADIKKGSAYLRNRQGARKATGSFFTKPFIVDHILDASLEPALKEHVARLRECDDQHAAEAFFDFRVIDIAMGSGHFLVSAIDRIERALSGVLAVRSLSAVTADLTRLEQAATASSPGVETSIAIEQGDLLRRQIARRCIYGVDVNPLSVELTRLSVWIHTFVPGLPLSFLDRNLIRGDSLVGVASLGEVGQCLLDSSDDKLPLFDAGVRELLARASTHMRELEKVIDADRQEVRHARQVSTRLHERLGPLNAIFDFVTAARIEPSLLRTINVEAATADELTKAFARPVTRARAEGALGKLTPVHFPSAFPEVFLRERAGFDVVIGNPPWEELTLERDRFWKRRARGQHSHTSTRARTPPCWHAPRSRSRCACSMASWHARAAV